MPRGRRLACLGVTNVQSSMCDGAPRSCGGAPWRLSFSHCSVGRRRLRPRAFGRTQVQLRRAGALHRFRPVELRHAPIVGGHGQRAVQGSAVGRKPERGGRRLERHHVAGLLGHGHQGERLPIGGGPSGGAGRGIAIHLLREEHPGGGRGRQHRQGDVHRGRALCRHPDPRVRRDRSGQPGRRHGFCDGQHYELQHSACGHDRGAGSALRCQYHDDLDGGRRHRLDEARDHGARQRHRRRSNRLHRGKLRFERTSGRRGPVGHADGRIQAGGERPPAAAHRADRPRGRGGEQQRDRPGLDQHLDQPDRGQDRALDRQRHLHPDRDRRRHRGQLPGHRLERLDHLLLSGPRHQCFGRLALFQHRQCDDAVAAAAAHRSHQPRGHGVEQQPDRPVLDQHRYQPDRRQGRALDRQRHLRADRGRRCCRGQLLGRWLERLDHLLLPGPRHQRFRRFALWQHRQRHDATIAHPAAAGARPERLHLYEPRRRGRQ